MWKHPAVLPVCLTLVSVAASASADDAGSLAALLAFPLIDPQVAQSEVEAFCHKRVPKVPLTDSLEAWKRQTALRRTNMFQRCIFRGEAIEWRKVPVDIVWLDVIEGGPGYRIKKLRYQILPGMWVPALLYEPTKLAGKVPVFMNVNGHDRGDGKAAKYKQLRCINQAKRGMLALNVEWLGMGQLNSPGFDHYRMNQLDLCGTSGIAPFYLAMERGLDVLLSHEHADPERVGVAGLSGGGWQTIFISALDTRVTLANPVAGYSSFLTRIHHHSDLGDSEQTPCDMATAGDYKHLTAMMAPRATLLTFNVADQCCFASGHALQPLVDAAEPAFRLHGQRERLATHVNHHPGTHNFEKDNREALYRMIGKHFFAGDRSFDAKEIDCVAELKTKDDLIVPLPPDNANFQALATRLATNLPRDRLPTESPREWIDDARKKLANIAKTHRYDVTTKPLPPIRVGDVTGRLWRLRMNSEWTVPAVELTQGEGQPKTTTILLAEKGRASATQTVEKLLAAGHRVLAVDPFYIGESKIPSRDFLFALLVGAVGERPVGIQASQLSAVARWTKQRHADAEVRLTALGERVCLSALVAAGLEPSIAGLELRGSLPTLKHVIEHNYGVNQSPEFFCFGLLAEFDIRELAGMVAPREVIFVDANARLKSEMAPLKSWYHGLGKDFDPLH